MTRHLAIGVIHGCYIALRALCDFVGLRDDDIIVTLGDYSNRGPSTREVFDWLLHLNATHNLKPLRGNHDFMMVKARHGESEFHKWLGVGGDATLQSYAPFDGVPGSLSDIPDNHWHFLTHNLLPYYESDTHFFVHANAYADVALEDQPDFMLYWEKWNDPPPHESGKIMVCGHTSQKTGLPISNGHSICIDTWACGDGWLTCLHAESGRIWQSNQRGQTRNLWMDELDRDDA
ncbi:MAG: metallophosphoesterase [Pirellula sp.]